MSRIIFPGSTIGIIGGGQLGKMLAIVAKQMGYKIAVLDPVKNGPCSGIVDYEINTTFEDIVGLRLLLDISHVVTYEFENIPGVVIKSLDGYGYIPQGFKPLSISQNRAIEKTAINDCGFKTAPFIIIESKNDLEKAMKRIGLPAVLKTCTGGYDGKGQFVLKEITDIDKCYPLIENNKCILEQFVSFKKEISVIVTRSTNGETAVFPVGENIHKNNILYQTIVPARIEESIRLKAQHIAVSLMKKLNFVGTLAVEMFVTEHDCILINEIAPRPHNTGHYTIEGCITSQFEQHIRAICGLKLGNTALRQPTVMVNILGQNLNYIFDFISNDQYSLAKIHLYGKSEAKFNRKMGHITFIDQNQKKLLENIDNLFSLDRGGNSG